MSNLRIIYDNAVDRGTVTASTTSGALVAANLQSDLKSLVHRSTGTSVTYTVTWSSVQTIGGVALPATNLSATATVRARAYNATSGGTLLADTGALTAASGQNLGNGRWSTPLNANAFALGGAVKAAVWFSGNIASVRRIEVDIVDSSNAAGYIDCSRLVAGPYWSPTYNADYGAQSGIEDTSTVRRTQAGDLVPQLGFLNDSMSLNLSLLSMTERAEMVKLMRTAGTSRNVFLSLLPADASATATQDHMIYGKRDNSKLGFDFYQSHSFGISIQGW